MTLGVLLMMPDRRVESYRAPLRRALAAAGIGARVAPDLPPGEVDYVIHAPAARQAHDFAPFTRLRAVLSLFAGVETLAPDPTLRVPLTRMVDDGMTRGMTEWVAAHVLRHHVGMDAHIVNPDRHWVPGVAPLACERRVSVLGLGALGLACARRLADLGFDVAGWSRTPKTVDGVASLHGADGLRTTLARADIAVLLLPLTAETEKLMDATRLALMPRGAVLLNPGRGPLVDDDALLAALDAGRLSHATLDVFRTEPLPKDHPFWAHPRVTVTPHVASETRPATAVPVLVENIRRFEAGEPPLNLVDRTRGY